jgi:hypothetical protein
VLGEGSIPRYAESISQIVRRQGFSLHPGWQSKIR